MSNTNRTLLFVIYICHLTGVLADSMFPGCYDSSVISPAAALMEPPGLHPRQLWVCGWDGREPAGLRQGGNAQGKEAFSAKMWAVPSPY